MNRITKALSAANRQIGIGLKAAAMRFGRTSQTLYSAIRWGKLNVSRLAGDAVDSSIVSAVLQWIMRTFPEAPIMVYDLDTDGNRTPNPIHPLVRLLRNPNPFYTGEVLWQATVCDYNATGEAFWRIIYNGVSEPIQLWWMPAGSITPQGDETTLITHYDYKVAGMTQAEPLKPEEVVHFRFGLDPRNPRRGRNPLATAIGEIFTDNEAAAYSGTLLYNLGVPGVVISPAAGTEIPVETAKDIKEGWPKKYGKENRGEPAVFSAPMQVATVSFSPKDMDLKDLRRLPEERISSLMGVHPIVVGLGAGLDRSTFSNYAEALEAAHSNNLSPTKRVFAAIVSHQLLPHFERDAEAFRRNPTREVGFDDSKVRALQEDQTALYNRANVAVLGGWFTVKQALEMTGNTSSDADDYYLRSGSLKVIPRSDTLPEPSEGPTTADELADAVRRVVNEEPSVPKSPNGTVTEMPTEMIGVGGAS